MVVYLLILSKNPDEQIKDIVEKLRPIIPLKTENLTLEISVPAQFVAQSYTVLKSTGSLKKKIGNQMAH